ncbi:MAG TPA: hypothetical protein VGE62_00685 [Candidatus Paceibacterota bacterium]
MKTIKSIITPTLLVLALFLGLMTNPFQDATAATAHFSVSASGSGSVYISVNADPNATVNLYYYPTGTSYPVSAGSIGTTNYAGSLTTTVSSNSYGIQGGNLAYVVVNGFQSSSVTWPTTTSTGGQVYLGQSSVSVNANQSASIQIGGGNGSYYVSSNSNSNVVSTSVSFNTLTVTGTSAGTSVITVCSQASSGGCANVTVYVNGGSWSGSSISLSQSSVTLQQGQTQYVSIYGNTGSYYISNNPGSNVASASIVGNSSLLITANNPGSATFNVCSTSSSQSCASVYVTVNSYYGYNNNQYYGNYYGSGYYNYNSSYYPYQYYQYSQYTQPQYYYQQQYAQPTYTYTQPTTYVQPLTYVSAQQPTYTYSQPVGQPVSGVYLNQVPSTGIGFGLKMALFSIGLLLWSLFGAYVLHKKGVTVESLFGRNARTASVSPAGSVSQSIAARFKEAQKQKLGL